jgi:TolB protein
MSYLGAPKFDIYVMNPDGSGKTNLTNTPGYSDVLPEWSPDGTRITYYAFDSGHDIFVMNADGSGQTNLTNSGASDTAPAWSPDGSKITFSSTRDGNPEIYVMNADGSGATRLTNNPAGEAAPDWQPIPIPIPPVGGAVELERDTLAPSAQGSDSPTPPYTALVGGLAAAVLALTAGAWCTRKRWARR